MLAAPIPADDAARLRRLRSLELLDTGAEAELDAYTSLAARATGCPVALISLVDTDRQWFKSAVGLPQGAQTSRQVSFCGHAIAGESLFEVEDARHDPRFADNPLVTGAPDVVHYAGVPLTMPAGERIGTLCVIDHAPGRLDASQRELLANLGRGVVDAMLLREQRRALAREHHLTQSETLAAFAPVGMCSVDAEGAVLHGNAQWQRLLGVNDRLDALGWNWLDAVHPGDAPLLQRAWLAAIAQRGNCDCLFRAGDRWLRVRLAPADTEIASAPFVAALLDMTEQRRLADALAEREQRLSMALRTTGLGLWDYAAEEDRLFLSEDWARRFGFADGAATVPLAALAGLSPPATVERFCYALGEVLRGRSPRLDIVHDMVAADGSVVWSHTCAEVVQRGPGGRAVRLVGTSKDITERVLHERALEAAVARADAANRAKADFLATMSHEIRTPINGVIGLARMLRASDLPPREAGWVRTVGSCADTLLALVNDVLDFSKIEAGQMTVECIPTALPALLQEVGELFAVRAADKGIGFRLQVDPAVPGQVLTDPLRLRQVLLNLLGNACKFTARGEFSLAARVAAGARGTAGELVLVVADTGAGIAPDALQRLFARYVQADASTARTHQGTGLGLAIVGELAALLGGTVQAESTPGVGSVFTVRLPLQLPAAAGAQLPPVPAAAADLPVAPLRILLVDDNEVNRMVGEALLAELGYTQVETAEDGDEAVQRVLASGYDLVLMDCQMPRLDGTDATRQLRAAGCDLPVIALSAGALAHERAHCLEAGMDDYLAKPVHPQALADALRAWGGRRHARSGASA